MRTAIWCVVGMACGALAGWSLGVDEYRAVAQLEVRPRQPKILYQVDETVSPQLALGRAETEAHAARMTSRGVLELALSSEELFARLPDVRPDALQRHVAARLVGDAPYHIGFEFTHPDPEVACAAANAVVDAYVKQLRLERPDGNVRRDRLEELGRELRRSLKSLQEREQAITESHGAAWLHAEYDRRVDAVSALTAQAGLLDNLIADAGASERARLQRRHEGVSEQLGAEREAVAQLTPRIQELAEILAERERLAAKLRAVDARLAEVITWKDGPEVVRVSSRATTPTEPASSNRPAMAILGALIGLVLVGGTAAGRRG